MSPETFTLMYLEPKAHLALVKVGCIRNIVLNVRIFSQAVSLLMLQRLFDFDGFYN